MCAQFHLLFHSSKGCISQGWARLSQEPGTTSRGPAFPGILAGKRTGSRAAGAQNGALVMGCQHPRWLNLLCHDAAPEGIIFKSIKVILKTLVDYAFDIISVDFPRHDNSAVVECKDALYRDAWLKYCGVTC